MCVSKKYLDPHDGGNWKFRRGRRLIGLGNFCGVGGLKTKIHFQRAPTFVSRSGAFIGHERFSYHSSAQNYFSFS